MTHQLKDMLAILDGIAPFSNAEEWDNPGFQVGFLSDEIKKVLISLDPTVMALQKAGERNAQLLLTHHPLIFKGLTSINPDTYPGCVITDAIRSRISIVAVHTNLDMAKGGINDILAGMIGLQDIEALLIKEAIEIEVRKRTPPTHFAGQIKELGDVINTLSAEDWGLKKWTKPNSRPAPHKHAKINWRNCHEPRKTRF